MPPPVTKPPLHFIANLCLALPLTSLHLSSHWAAVLERPEQLLVCSAIYWLLVILHFLHKDISFFLGPECPSITKLASVFAQHISFKGEEKRSFDWWMRHHPNPTLLLTNTVLHCLLNLLVSLTEIYYEQKFPDISDDKIIITTKIHLLNKLCELWPVSDRVGL